MKMYIITDDERFWNDIVNKIEYYKTISMDEEEFEIMLKDKEEEYERSMSSHYISEILIDEFADYIF